MRDRSSSLRLLAVLVLAGALDARQENTPPTAAAQDTSAERAFVDDLAEKMRHLPFFSHHGFDKVDDLPGYWILVQRGDKSSPERAETLARAAVELLEPTQARFEAERAEPLGLTRRADRPRLVLAILNSRADYDECYRDTTAAWHFEAQATFERDLGAAILYAVDGKLDDDAERVRGARHMLVHALQQAWYGGGDAAPVRSWLFEGMADFLSFDAGDADALPARVRQFAADAADPHSRWVNLRTLSELCTVDEPLALGQLFAAQTPTLQPPSEGDPWAAFYREAALLYRFLHESSDGRYKKALLAYEKRAFRGAHALPDFTASLSPRKLPDVQRAFLDWIHEQHRAAFPDVALDRDLVRDALERTDTGAPILPDEPARVAPPSREESPAPSAKPPERPRHVAIAPVSTAPVVVAPSAATPATIAYDDASPEERYAAALADVGAGNARAASDALAALAAELAGTDLGARVAREEERVAAWTAARDAFFAKAAAEDLTLELTVARVSTTKWRLRAVEDGQAVLDDRKGGVKRVPVEELDPLALARQMEGVEPAWTRFYVYVLREDERWKKLLKEDGGPASALLEDARTDYPRLVRLGRAVAGLRGLAKEPAGTAEAELERQLHSLKALLGELGDTELVERKRPLLHDHALALLERRFTLQNPLKRLAGKAELSGKRLRVAYDFSDARQLADFDPTPYPVLASKGFSGPEGEEGGFTVDAGRLVATGRASLRTVYDLGAPMKVLYDVEFVDKQLADPHFHLALGICDDGQEHFLWALNLNTLQLLDRSGTDYTEDPPRALYLDTRYAMELTHDGQRVTLRCEGLEQATLGAGNRSSGAVFLRAVGTIPVRVDTLVIEGQLLPESFTRMQRAWAEAQMASW